MSVRGIHTDVTDMREKIFTEVFYDARTENLAKHAGREAPFIPAGISGWSFPVLYRVPVPSERPQTRPSEGQGFH